MPDNHPDSRTNSKPVVLCFSGHDPSGGAGIQADIEAITAQGAHAATVITALTVQDSNNVSSFTTTDADNFIQQAELVLADMPVQVIKIGMTGSVEIIKATHQIITKHRQIPVVLDPVLAAGGGTSLGDDDSLVDALKQYILPYCTLITPNIPEALALSGCEHIDEAAQALLETGTKSVLITGTHSNETDVQHRLVSSENSARFVNPRLPGEYHGSGCTLTSAIAAKLAQQHDMTKAVRAGLDFTFRSLQAAHQIGKGQLMPDRSVKPQIFGSAVRLVSADASDDRLQGLYAITDEELIGLYFEPAVEQALKGGARIIQYRNKSTNQNRRLQQAQILRRLCDQYNSLLIINDDIELAQQVAADGVHIGKDDSGFDVAREKLGVDKIIGVSCYNDIELARQAEAQGADYVAFGAFFSSTIKPEATSAELALLEQARQELSIPICCIGGITADNAAPLITAGSHMLAVISDVFAKSPEDNSIQQSAECLSQLFSD